MGDRRKTHDTEMESAASENIIQKESEKLRSRIPSEPKADSEPENIGESKIPPQRKRPLLIAIFNLIYMVLITICTFFAISFFFEYKNDARADDFEEKGSINLIKSVGCGLLAVLIAFSKVYMTELYPNSSDLNKYS